MGIYYYYEKNNDCGVGVVCVGGWCVLFLHLLIICLYFGGICCLCVLLLWVYGCNSVVIGGAGYFGWALLWPSYLFGSFVSEWIYHKCKPCDKYFMCKFVLFIYNR